MVRVQPPYCRPLCARDGVPRDRTASAVRALGAPLALDLPRPGGLPLHEKRSRGMAARVGILLRITEGSGRSTASRLRAADRRLRGFRMADTPRALPREGIRAHLSAALCCERRTSARTHAFGGRPQGTAPHRAKPHPARTAGYVCRMDTLARAEAPLARRPTPRPAPGARAHACASASAALPRDVAPSGGPPPVPS